MEKNDFQIKTQYWNEWIHPFVCQKLCILSFCLSNCCLRNRSEKFTKTIAIIIAVMAGDRCLSTIKWIECISIEWCTSDDRVQSRRKKNNWFYLKFCTSKMTNKMRLYWMFRNSEHLAWSSSYIQNKLYKQMRDLCTKEDLSKWNREE